MGKELCFYILPILLLPPSNVKRVKKVHIGLADLKHTTSAYLGRTTVWMGLVPPGIEVASWISSSCRHCSVFLFCRPRGASVYPQTQHFPFDCYLGFRMVGGDSSSHRGYNTSICQNGQDSLWPPPWGAGSAQDPASLWPPARKWQTTDWWNCWRRFPADFAPCSLSERQNLMRVERWLACNERKFPGNKWLLMETGAWWATVRGVAKTQTRLSDWACTHNRNQFPEKAGRQSKHWCVHKLGGFWKAWDLAFVAVKKLSYGEVNVPWTVWFSYPIL